jgi:hypothetical protein
MSNYRHWYVEIVSIVGPDVVKQIGSNLDTITGFHEWELVGRYKTSQLYYLPYAKWYSYQENMRKLSALYPEVLFEVSNDDDDWKLYVKNGKIKEVEAIKTFPEYNESELS